MRIHRALLQLLLLLLLALPLTASAKAQMAEFDGYAVPPDGKALVVFLRPSPMARKLSTSMFEVSGEQETFIGIVEHNHRVGYVAEPGRHLFMVLGGGGILEAELDADKTYYVLVNPAKGAWVASFMLLPMRTDPTAVNSVHSTEFAKWLKSSRWMRNSPATELWYAEKKAEIEGKRQEALEEWNERSERQKKKNPPMRAEDGVTSP